MAKDGDKAKQSPKSSTMFNQNFVVLIVVLVLILGVTGIAVASEPSSTKYSCITITNKGGGVDLTTTGIIHVSGSQYFITCAEGDADITAPATFSCLTISPQSLTTTYPDNAPLADRYYLNAPANAVSLQGVSGNQTEISPSPSITIQVSC